MDGMYRRKIGMLVGAFNQEMALVGRSLLCDYKRASCGPSFEALAAGRSKQSVIVTAPGSRTLQPSPGFQDFMNKYVKEKKIMFSKL